MPVSHRLFIVLLLGGILGSFVAVSAAADPARYALLIGIDDYEIAENLRSLTGPSNDIALMRRLLETRFEIPADNIVTLLDAKATHSGVRQAFTELAQRAKSGDFVYIHYSGHGSYTEDKNGDEPLTGEDQTWVPYGARSDEFTGDDSYDILDDEINDWLTDFKTENIVFVSDSCHSGTAFRGEPYGVRSAPNDDRTHPLADKVFRTPSEELEVRIGSARDIEEAIEILTEEDKVYGLFTWYWAKALKQATPGESWRDVFQRVHTLVTTHPSARQQPQLTGNPRQPVFGGDFVAPGTTVPVIQVSLDAGEAEISAGAVAGVTVGSLFSQHRPEAGEGEELPRLEITRIEAFSSTGKILQGAFERGDLVVETAHVYPFTPYRLYLDPLCGRENPNDKDSSLREGLTQALDDLRGFNLVQQREGADWLVCVLRPREQNGKLIHEAADDSLPRYFPEENPEVWIVNQGFELLHERMRVSLQPPETGYRVIRENLDKFARVQEILRLGVGQDQARLPVNLRVRLLREAPNCRQDCVTLPFEGFQDRPYREMGSGSLEESRSLSPKRNDIMRFTVHNDGHRDYYIYVLNIARDGGVQAIFPPPYARNEYARAPAGEQRELSETALLLDAAGDEIVKLIVSAKPIDIRLFESEGYEVYRTTRGSLNPLERLLDEAMYTRAQTIRVAPADWASRQAEFQVAE